MSSASEFLFPSQCYVIFIIFSPYDAFNFVRKELMFFFRSQKNISCSIKKCNDHELLVISTPLDKFNSQKVLRDIL